MFIPASIKNCQNTSKPSIQHSVNLPVLLEFYKEYEEIYNISSRKTFAEPISIGLPNFDVVQKRFSDVISHEKDAELSLKKIVSNVKSKNRMYVTETSKLIDDLGFLANLISNKLQNVFLGLSFLMSTFALAVKCRNYRMLTIIKTIEAFDFLKTQIASTPTPENNVISDELHSLIKLLITIFITIFITGLAVAASCLLRRIVHFVCHMTTL